MFDRRRLVVRAVAILLMFTASRFALADDADEYRSEVHDVIEEIVVVARKNSQRPNLRNNSDIDPAVQMPAWIDLQFLPRYDPEQADRYFDLIQHDEIVRRAGFIELFRLSFGR